MILGMLALVGALWGGLLRLGWTLSPPFLSSGAFHGPLMVSGFLGTLIGLERAVALGLRWTYAVPFLTGLGALALVGGPDVIGRVLLSLGSAGLSVVSIFIVSRQPAPFTLTVGLGALAWLVGNILWLAGWPIFRAVPWWIGFLVLTIAGERLEFSRLLSPPPGSRTIFGAAVGLFLAGLLLVGVVFDAGARLVGGALVVLAFWLLRYDIARRTLRHKGLHQFAAVCLLSGYMWLGVGGFLWLLAGGVVAGPWYDAILHALLLGFVFAMIFGHAPIILPAVLGCPIPFRAAFYAPLALVHLSLAVRVAGDLVGWWPGRTWGGTFNVVGVLLFFGIIGWSICSGRKAKRDPP
jgi:hypothetical protein